MGGFVTARAEVVEFLRQKARPNLFSSALTVPDTAANLAAVAILEQSDEPVRKLWENGRYFKDRMKAQGFDTGKSETPITPVIVGDSNLAKKFSARLFDEGVFATAIAFPTVPMGTARIRAMVSAAHGRDDLDQGVEIFARVGRELKIIP